MPTFQYKARDHNGRLDTGSLSADSLQAAAHALRAVCEELAPGRATVVNGDAMRWLRAQDSSQPFDLAFIDPPFDSTLGEESLDLIRMKIHGHQSVSSGCC